MTSAQATTSTPSGVQIAQMYPDWPLIEIYGVGPDGTTCMCPKGAKCSAAGKHPRARKVDDEILNWADPANATDPSTWRKRANVGVLTGAPAGFWVLDIDANGLEAMAGLTDVHGKLPATRVHRTGGGTYHYFFATPDFNVTNSSGRLPKGIDVRGTGGQVVLPPSTSAKGAYAVLADEPIAEAPAWLLDLIRPTDDEPIFNEPVEKPSPDVPIAHDGFDDFFAGVEAPASTAAPTSDFDRDRAEKYETTIVDLEVGRLVAMGQAATLDGKGCAGEPWDATTYEVACKLFEVANAEWSALTKDQARDLVLEHAPRDGGFDDARVNEKIRSALGKVGSKARALPAATGSWVDNVPSSNAPVATVPEGATVPKREPNDVGNARRLVDHHGNEIRWTVDAQAWVAYDGRRWDDLSARTVIARHAIDTIEAAAEEEAGLYSDVPDEFDSKGEPKSDPRSRFFEWIGKSKFEARLKAMVNVAQADPRIAVKMGAFGGPSDVLNCANGVVSLRDGSISPHDPELMLKGLVDIAYDPTARAPMFEAFLARVQPDPAMRDYLQRMAGYSITGETSEQAMFIHNGHGANGKSVFLEIIREVMGDLGQKVARDTLMSKGNQGAGIPSDVAGMLGARFLAASETKAGQKLDDERIKELVGGEGQRTRHLFGKWFDFNPTGKIHLATNHLPAMESGGHGMGRRLRVIPWEVTIPDAEQDKMLKDKILAAEAPGVLAWLVAGAQGWYERGMAMPDLVRKRTDEHVEDADPLWPFIHEKLTPDPEIGTEFSTIYGQYESWCEFNGYKPMSGKALSQGLVERLGHSVRGKDYKTRRSVFHLRVNLMAVPTTVANFFEGTGS